MNDFSPSRDRRPVELAARRGSAQYSYTEYPGYIAALALVKRACARANADAGYLGAALLAAIERACDSMAAGECNEHMPLAAPEDADYVLSSAADNALAAMASKLSGLDVSPGHVALSQGGRDVMLTVNTLVIHDWGNLVLEVLPGLEQALEDKAKAFHDHLKMGRIYLRDAAPVSLGDVFAGYAAQVRRLRARLAEAVGRWNKSALGAGLTGTGLECVPGFAASVHPHLSRLCGRAIEPWPNMFDALQNADEYVLFHAHLQTIAMAVGKIARDMTLMTSGPQCGFSDVRIPATQPGSSIMPGKINPVVPDMLTQTGYRVSGNQAGIAHAAYAGELESGPGTGMMLRSIHETVSMLRHGIPIFVAKTLRDTVPMALGLGDQAARSPGILSLVAALCGSAAAAAVRSRSRSKGISLFAALEEEGLFDALSVRALTDPANLAKPQNLIPLMAALRKQRADAANQVQPPIT